MVDETNNQPIPDDPGLADSQRALELIAGAQRGDRASIDELVKLIYPELKRRARWLMTGERTGHTFGPSGSELVQRVMERILESGGTIFRAASTEEELIRMLTRRMRFILVDYARAAVKHGKPTPRNRVPLDDLLRSARATQVDIEEVLGTHEALARLAEEDKLAAQSIELRVFGGLTNEEAAAALGLSVATFRRTLGQGKAFLKELMGHPKTSSNEPSTQK